MPITEIPEPDEHEDDELPSRFLIFTCPDLDQDEDIARKAGARVESVLRDIIDSVGDLEDIERALREAEATSARARRAREQLLHALGDPDDLIVGVAGAWDALTFHWNTTTPVSP